MGWRCEGGWEGKGGDGGVAVVDRVYNKRGGRWI
jgi:hypothetical protein